MNTAGLSNIASIGSSLDAFFDAVGAFFSNLAAVSWGMLFLALLLNLAHLTFRTRAWFNVLRAAYPHEQIQWRGIFGSYIAGVGINSVIPAHVGDVVKIYLGKTRVPNSSYPAVGSSFFVQSIFDMAIGTLVLIFALTQGVLPSIPDLPAIPAFDLSYLAAHPKFTLFLLTFFAIAAIALFAWLAVRVQAFWDRVKQGWAIVSDRSRYIREVVLFQAIGWIFRLASFYAFLAAFNLDANLRNALIVMSVQSLSTMMPFTPGGAGAQQALLAFVFRGQASQSAVLSFSVGSQIALAGFNAAMGFAALFVMMRTFDYKRIVRRGEREKAAGSG